MRQIIFLILAGITPLIAQQPTNQGRVLKALPLNFEELQHAVSHPDPTPAVPDPTPAVPDPSPVIPDITTKSLLSEPNPAPPETSSINQKPTGEDAVRLQIFLDQSNFGPGIIDGRIGQFSELAV